MPILLIDQTTPQPNGKFGDDAFVAFEKTNLNVEYLDDRINTSATSQQVTEAVAAEATLRTDADAQLQQAITAEAQARGTADTALSDAISAEVQARQTADTGLAAAVSSVRLLLGKNVLINGNFDFNQRAVTGSRTSAVAEEFYTTDRWVCGFVNVNGNWGVGGTPLGAIRGSRRYLGFNITSVASNNSAAYIGQKVENCDTLAGKTVTLSLWARSNVAGKKIGARLLQLMGTGGSPSPNTSTENSTPITLTTEFQRYSFTFTLPSVLGKTRGSSGNDSLFVVLDYCAPASFYGGALVGQTGLFEVAQIQLEEGSTASDFAARPLGTELVLCQRYYEKSYDVDTDPRTATSLGREAQYYDRTTGTQSTSQIRFKVTKRAIPAVGVFSDVTGDINRVSGNSGGAGVVNGVVAVGTNGCQVNYTSASGQWGSGFQWAADAEL